MVEAAESRETLVERTLAGMAERRMAEIVGQRQRFGEVFVESEHAGKRSRHLSDFERMGQPRAVMVALVEDKDLGFVLEPAEGGRVDNAVAIAPERAAVFADGLGMKAATAPLRVAGITRAGHCVVRCHDSLQWVRPAACCN